MEIEAKFAVPGRVVYRRLARLRSLAGYRLAPRGVTAVTDRYCDTADGRILAARYACRVRSEGDGFLATLKGLGGASGAVHRREEYEVGLPLWEADPAAWPASPTRNLALELTGGGRLAPLFELTQRRARADVLDGDRLVAELSLDAVRVAIGPRPMYYYELEVELRPAGAEADLARLTGELSQVWALQSEPASKFERGLALWRAHRAAVAARLTSDERVALRNQAASGARGEAQRAQVVLDWGDGLSLREIAARSGLTPGAARYRIRAFRSQQAGGREQGAGDRGQESVVADQRISESALPAGPQSAVVDASGPADADQRISASAYDRSPIPQPAARSPLLTPLPSVAEFCEAHGVDPAHARFVARQARALFDALRPIHGLPKKRCRLLRSAAWLFTLGPAVDAAHPDRAGRDWILAQPLRNLATGDRLALACIAACHRDKPKPEREPTWTALDAGLQGQVKPIAALVRLADGLDVSHTQAAEIVEINQPGSRRCEIVMAGATEDLAEVNRRASWWRKLYKQELIFRTNVPAAPDTGREESGSPSLAPSAEGVANADGRGPSGSPASIRVPPQPAAGAVEGEAAAGAATVPRPAAILPDDPMSEAGRKVLALHFGKMLANEAGTRLGEEIEALHDMRVATRRMRAAAALFEPYFDRKTLKPLLQGLRRTGRTLGAVRDLDVLLEKAHVYAATLPAEQVGGLDPLLAHWTALRETAREALLAYLDGAAYHRFCADFGAFAATPGAGAPPPPVGEPIPHQVRHVVPRLIQAHYESVRAYEAVIADAPLTTYHQLRIQCKALRYALEFFRDVLGSETPELIKQVTAMQDLLGALQDAHVAAGLLTEFLDRAGPLPAVASYLAAQHTSQAELLGRFPAPWSALIGLDFRKALGLAAAAL
jgi:CHAD domain-containing protein